MTARAVLLPGAESVLEVALLGASSDTPTSLITQWQPSMLRAADGQTGPERGAGFPGSHRFLYFWGTSPQSLTVGRQEVAQSSA